MLIDSHAHILHERIDTKNVITSMHEDGLEKIITIGTSVETSIKSVKLAKENKDIYAVVGMHPDEAGSFSEADLETIDRLALEDKVVAIGEIGLDYFTSPDTKEKQKELFIAQINIAKKHHLPIVIHSRAAAFDTYWILKQNLEGLTLPSLMHCFSENKEYANLFLSLGFYISFSGNITYKKSDRSFLKDIPMDKILVETDSPYLSPEPFRGRTNEPKMVEFVARRIAQEIGMDFEEFSRHTRENTYRIFSRMKR